MYTIIFNIAMIALCVYLFYLTTEFRESMAQIWPRIIIIIIIVTNTILLVINFINIKGKKHKENISINNKKNNNVYSKRFIVAVFFTVLYIYLIQYLGVVFFTPIFMVFFMYFMGLRKKIILVIVSIVFTLFLVIAFTKIMTVILPRGQGIFRVISRLIY